MSGPLRAQLGGRLALFIRDADRTRAEATTRWARELADGVAPGTQTRAQFTVAFGLSDLLPNTLLVERLHEHLQAVGVPAWTDRARNPRSDREEQRDKVEDPEAGRL